jgi:hypothetical protein
VRQPTRQPVSSTRGFLLRLGDDLAGFGHDLLMQHDTAGLDIRQSTLDPANDFKLAIHIGRNGLGGEERLAATGVGRDPLELPFGFGRNSDYSG